MKRKLLLVLACVLVLFVAVSCDADMREKLFGYMDKASENVLAPEVTGNVDAVKDIVSGITSSDNQTTVVTDDSGNVKLGKMDSTEMENLIEAITKAGSDVKQKEALQEALKEPVTEEQKEAVKNSVNEAKDAIDQGLGDLVDLDALLKADSETINDLIEQEIGSALQDLPEAVTSQVSGLVSGLVESINAMTNPDANVTQADLITAQMTVTVVAEVMETLTAITNPTDPDAPFDPTSPEGLATVLDLAENLEALSNVGNATGASFNPFGNLNVGSLISGLIPGMQ